MATVTMDQVINFRNKGDTFGELHLPLKAAYKLNKIRKAVDKEGDFYIEKFQEIVKKYAKTDENGELIFSEDGEQIMIQDGMVDECNKELAELQELSVEIETYGLKIEDFGEDIECTPDDLAALMPFIE